MSLRHSLSRLLLTLLTFSQLGLHGTEIDLGHATVPFFPICSITGKVVDESGKGVVGADVTLPRQNRADKTSLEGYFLFTHYGEMLAGRVGNTEAERLQNQTEAITQLTLQFGTTFVTRQIAPDVNQKSRVLMAAEKAKPKGVWSATELRKLPGTAKGGKALRAIGDKWFRGTHGNVGVFPKKIADKLKGRRFKNWDEIREVFWKEVASDPQLSKQFSKQNLTRMQIGGAPFVHRSQTLRNQKTYQIHHKKPIHDGGGVYDMDNHVIVTPRYHKEILSQSYHYNK